MALAQPDHSAIMATQQTLEAVSCRQRTSEANLVPYYDVNKQKEAARAD
jgi:hypothetical protein